jgi:TonB family protein
MGRAENPSSKIALLSKGKNLINELGSDTSQVEVIDNVEEFEISEENLSQYGIVIFDVDQSEEINDSVEKILDIKRTEPAVILFALGSPDNMSALLASPVQNIVYRAFNKPVSKNQVSLAFNSALAEHKNLLERRENGEDIDVVSAGETDASIETLSESKSSKTAIIAIAALLILAPIAYFLLSSGSDNSSSQTVQNTDQSATIEQSDGTSGTDLNSQINDLNQRASSAILEGRLIGGKDSALDLYDQVLELDPYDATAYDGKKEVATTLRDLFPSFLEANQFDESISIIDALSKIDFLAYSDNPLDGQLSEALERYIKEVSASGDKEQLAAASQLLEKIGGDNSVSQKALQAAQQEQQLLERIMLAIENDNLVPPKKDNAYSLVSFARKRNVVRDENLTEPNRLLSEKLIELANQSLKTDNIEEASKVVALLDNLGSASDQVAALTDAIKAKTPEAPSDDNANAKTAEQTASNAGDSTADTSPAEAEKDVEPDRIIPAKLITRVSPKYPRSANRKGIEGHVSVSFSINKSGSVGNIKVVESVPEGVFDKAATDAVKQWKFSPARNERTSEAIESEIQSLKLSFKFS